MRNKRNRFKSPSFSQRMVDSLRYDPTLRANLIRISMFLAGGASGFILKDLLDDEEQLEIREQCGEINQETLKLLDE